MLFFLYDHELHEVYVLDVYCICYHFLNSLNQNNPLSNFKINSKKTTKVAVGIIAMWSAECYGRDTPLTNDFNGAALSVYHICPLQTCLQLFDKSLISNNASTSRSWLRISRHRTFRQFKYQAVLHSIRDYNNNVNPLNI